MPEKIFVIGGCRSGKSSHALKIAEEIAGKRVFLATLRPYDEEMQDRVLKHQKERTRRQWETVEEPVFLPSAIVENCKKADVILADCLTLWVSNLFMEERNTGTIGRRLKPRVRFDEKSGKFYRQRTMGEVEVTPVPTPSLPDWVMSRIPTQ